MGQLRASQCFCRDLSGRKIRPSDGCLASDCHERGQIVVGSCIQKRVFGQGARGHQPDHPAFDHRFRATLLCLGRRFKLFADSDAEPFADQGQKIALGGMYRDPAHRDILTLMLAPLGQCDVERGCGGLGILEEQLVEIAHPIEQERHGISRLDLQKLRHHWRHACAHACPPVCWTTG